MAPSALSLKAFLQVLYIRCKKSLKHFTGKDSKLFFLFYFYLGGKGVVRAPKKKVDAWIMRLKCFLWISCTVFIALWFVLSDEFWVGVGPWKPGKSWNFILTFSKTGKTWRRLQVLESPRNLLKSSSEVFKS